MNGNNNRGGFGTLQRGVSVLPNNNNNNSNGNSYGNGNAVDDRMDTRPAVLPSASNVKSGRADTFDPAVMGMGTALDGGGGGDQQGLFVDRSKRDLQIAEVCEC